MSVESAKQVLEEARSNIEFFVWYYLIDKGFTLLLEELAGDKADGKLLLRAYQDLGVNAHFKADQIVEGAYSFAYIMKLVWKMPEELLPLQTPTSVILEAAVALFNDKARRDFVPDNNTV